LIAAHGQHAWRVEPGADVPLLLSLSAVQHELSDSLADAEIDRDAELSAVIAAIGRAIGRLPQPYRDAATEQFGFSDPDLSTARKKGARERAAAEKLGIAQRMYEKPTTKYGGLSRREHVIGLVTVALCDPAAARSSPAPEASGANGATLIAPPRRRWQDVWGSRRVIALFGGIATLLVVGLGIGAWRLDQSSEAAPPPPLGSVIDASSGKLYSPHPIAELVTPIGGLDTNATFLTPCDPGLAPCVNGAKDIAVRPGDTMTIRLFLTTNYEAPISWLKLLVEWEPSKDDLDAQAIWLTPQKQSSYGNGYEMQLTDQRLNHHLDYVPGSTRLSTVSQESEGKLLARLPDGIMANGIVLTNVGPPAGCAGCIDEYSRVVTFKARMLDGNAK